MTVLVTGARGRVGRAVVDALLAAGDVDVRATSRDPARLDLPVPVAAADLADPASLHPALEGVDQVFLYADAQGAPGVVEVLREAGIAHVVVLSSISVVDAPEGGIGREHRVVEDAVLASGVPTTLLRPEAFATNTLDWGPDVRRRGVVETPHAGAHTRPIHERDIADVAVDALRGGSARGRAITLTGPDSLTFADQVRAIAAEIGRDVTLVELDEEQFRERLAAEGTPGFVADTLLPMWAATVGVPQPVHPVSEVLAQRARTYAEWVRDHREAFSG